MKTIRLTESEFAWLRALMAAFSANSDAGDDPEQVKNADSIDAKLRRLSRRPRRRSKGG